MISIIQQPISNGEMVFHFQSDNPNICYFKMDLFESKTLQTIQRIDIYPLPNYPNGAYINLSTIPNFTTDLEFTVQITERGIINGVIKSLDTPTLLPDTYTIRNR